MSRPPHPPWFNHPNNIRRRIQVMKLIIMQFSPWSIFLPFRSKYLPQHSVPKNPTETPYIPSTKSHVLFPLLRSCQRISPSPRRFETFPKNKNFYGEALLAPCPTSNLEDHPLSAVRDCLVNIVTATLLTQRTSLHPQSEDAPCRGDNGPTIYSLKFCDEFCFNIPVLCRTLSIVRNIYKRDAWKVRGLATMRHSYAKGGGDCYSKL
jgi:hypothetical protein